MLFSSMIFLWVFLPIVLVGNLLIGKFCDKRKRLKTRNAFLLICSFIFYAWGGIYYLLIMLFSIGLNYLGGFFVNPQTVKQPERKRNLIIVIALNLGMLFIFKYFNIMIDLVENLLDKGPYGLLYSFLYTEGTGKLGIGEIALPIGISFFTFQAMSYVLDVYSGKAKVQPKLLNFALYVSFFPQLIAGPIVKYSDIAEQLRHRSQTTDLMLEGMRRFIYGLSKKVIIANSFGSIADQIWALETSRLGGPVAWLGMISYTIQIYYDFSGYSDMAIGLGKMLGFQFKENFNYPYTAQSVQDFWRRWHISLSSWFREYVYFPLGGSRCSLKRTCLNVFIVFLLTGIWHGANFTFLLWGIFYAGFLILERVFLGDYLKKNPVKIINWLYTMIVVMLNWVIFRSDNIVQAFTFIGQLFRGASAYYSVFSYLSMQVLVLFVVVLLFSGFLQNRLGGWYRKMCTQAKWIYAEYAWQLLLLVICVLKLINGTYNAFIYYQF